jgi:hypothetical protein
MPLAVGMQPRTRAGRFFLQADCRLKIVMARLPARLPARRPDNM